MTANQFQWGLDPKVYTDPSDFQVSTLLLPATRIVALPVNGTAFPPPRAIIGDKVGAATVTDSEGNTLTSFPITGVEQHLCLTAISSLSTTTKVWGLY